MEELELEALYRAESGPLFNIVLRRVWVHAVADEIVQEAFCRLWAKRDRIQLPTVRAYLYRIALNLARRHCWRTRLVGFLPWSETQAEHYPSNASASTQLETDETDALLKDALEYLSGPFREVLLLTEFSELSYREAAQALGVAEGTIASRRRRALDKLRQYLASRGFRYDSTD